MKNQRIHISIAFADAILPIVECDDGLKRVPLKPICDQIGIQWKRQKTKLLNDEYLKERFGLVLGIPRYPSIEEKPALREQYLIRLDRVTAFLNTLSPRNIKAQGNVASAEWLKAKHSEWDDALHAYETNGFAAKSTGNQLRDALYKLDRIKNPHIKTCMAKSINTEFALDLPIAKQQSLDV